MLVSAVLPLLVFDARFRLFLYGILFILSAALQSMPESMQRKAQQQQGGMQAC
jgi:hypothetical protein